MTRLNVSLGSAEIANLLQMMGGLIPADLMQQRSLEVRLSRHVGITGELTTSVVFTATTNFHYARLLRVLAVLAAILAALFGGTITGRMSARLLLLIFCHIATPSIRRSLLLNV